jgi:hypothetical protein
MQAGTRLYRTNAHNAQPRIRPTVLYRRQDDAWRSVGAITLSDGQSITHALRRSA